MLDKDSEDRQYMADLYNGFLQNLQEGRQEYYEKEDLLNIFDYAQDEGDDMVQLEVVCTAARLFPTDDFLDERKAFLLSVIDSEAALRFKALKKRPRTMLWNMLEFSIKADHDNADKLVEKLLKHKLVWDAESVIRLFDTLQELDRVDLVAASVEPLLKLTEYPDHMLYEAAEMLAPYSEYEAAARDIAEELTKREAFNFNNWMLLSRCEYNLGNYADAVTACDYALAIDPDNRRALTMKAVAQVAGKGTRKEGIDMLYSLFDAKKPDSIAIGQALAEALRVNRRKKAAIEVYRELLREHPDSAFFLVPDALAMKTSRTISNEFLGRLYEQVDTLGNEWASVARYLVQNGHSEQALIVYDYMHDHFGRVTDPDEYIKLLYEDRRFSDVVDFFQQINIGGAPDDANITTLLYVMSSLLMCGHYKDVEMLTSLMLERSGEMSTSQVTDNLEWRGMEVVLALLQAFARNPKSIPCDRDFDPLKMVGGINVQLFKD